MYTALTLICVLSCSLAHANLVLPDDGPYYRLRDQGTLYVFSDDVRADLPELSAFTDALRPLYRSSFGWTLDEEEDVILASANNQYANAFATVSPNLKTFWWPSGAGEADALAVPSWGRLIASHETAHLYQLNAKGTFNQRLKRVFGNANVVTLLPVPFFIHPNLITPTSLLEGNAVLNESRLNLGGRLHSGEVRATVLRLIAAGQVDPSRLINDQFKFPYGEAAYDLGAYFMAHLNSKYGLERTNGFFRAQGDHWLNPLILNRTFRAHFGSSFYQEAREFPRELEPLAHAQRTTTGSPLSEGLQVSPLNHDERRVWWLSNVGYRTPDLFVFDKQTGRIERRAIDLLNGKVFDGGGGADHWLTAATNRHDLHHRSYGLYGEHAHLEPGSAGEIVTDRRGGHQVGLDAARSWLKGLVVLDGRAIDVANSNPILDTDGNVYLFRQNGAERLLYRNHEVLARVGGYYAKLTEVDERGRVHFIAATDRGSSLFRWGDGELTRLLDSDVVFDARVLPDERALVDEVTATGHRVLIASLYSRPEAPAVYAYPFASETLRPAPVRPDAAFAAAPRYEGLKELRFSELSVGLGYAPGPGAIGALGALFRDPLEYHEFSFDLGYSSEGPRRAQVRYGFERYLVKPFARYTYGEDTWRLRRDDSLHRTVEQELNLGFDLPWLRHERWDGLGTFNLIFAREGPDEDERVTHHAFGTLTEVRATRVVPSPIGMYPWRGFGIALAHRFVEDPVVTSDREQSASLETTWDRGFEGEYYLSAAAQLAASDGTHLRVSYLPSASGTRLTVPRLNGETFHARYAGRARLEGRRVITLPRYDTRLPIGINRVALLLSAQSLATSGADADVPANVLEAGYGVDLDLLLAHKLRFTTRFMNGVTNDPATGDRSFTQVSLVAKGTF